MPNGSLRGIQLKDRIVDILRGDGKSISEIYKEINMEDETKIHRLALTGYLWAMADFNVLKEKYVKPSKLYFLLKKDEKSIYELIGEQTVNETPDKRGEEILYILYTLFDRPIFDIELERAGITGNIKGKRLDKRERKKLIGKVDIKGLKVTTDSDAYLPLPSALYPALAMKVLSNIISEKYEVKREKMGIQKELDSVL
ncbi:MAG: hypothetical protein M0Z77_11135 [Thermoplasmatales archaeon]|jgi:hypothetical protein|nr:hypothetical protein [Candidatus Thermoplasmatota archaeon]MCL6002140.1 hypothetical protein [Candidatus Thermoplasmatota archaeon]MDA8056182.1 hypothetical protein [Thermoplasmatales archaeon]